MLYKDRKSALVYSIMTLLWIIPILLANNLYRDDYVRQIQKTTIWEYAGRPFASWLYNILSLSPFEIHNLYPLPTLLSGLVAFVGLYLLHQIFQPVISEGRVNKIMIYPVIGFVFFNPFVLQNWLYQYDVLSMILALLISIFIFYLPFSRKNFFYSVLLLIIALGMYQPATPIFVFLVLINNIINIKKSVSKMFSSLYYGAIYILSHIGYYVLVKFLLPIPMVRGEILHTNGYFEHFKYNAIQFLEMINSLHISNICIGIFSLFLILFSIFAALKSSESLKEKIISIISIPSLFFFIWGPLSVLEEPLEYPREFMATGILLSLFFILIFNMKKCTIISIFSIPLILYFYICLVFVQLSQYNQNKYQNENIDNMSYHLYQNENAYKSIMIFSYGQMSEDSTSKKIKEYLPYVGIMSKPDYRWQIRYRMAVKGMNYTASTYTLMITDSKSEWNRICHKKDPILSKIYSNNDYDIYFDKSKKYTVIWWKSSNNDICKQNLLEKDPE